MRNFGIVTLHFGAAASEPISKKIIEFYHWVVSSVTNSKYKMVDNSSDSTIALNLQECTEDKSAAYTKFISRVQSWGNKAEVAIVDICRYNNIIPGPTELHIAQAINFILDDTSQPYPNLFIILLDQIPPTGESFRQSVERWINKGNIIIIDNSGQIISKSENALNIGEFKDRIIEIQESPYELFKKKIVRRLGHFKRNPHSNTCTRFFYDGSECEQELFLLFKTYLNENYPNGCKPLFLYYSENSDWLSQPVIALAQKNECCFAHIDIFLADHEKYRYDKSVEPLLIFPFLDTGNTIETKLIEWKRKNIGPLPKILSVLGGSRATEERGYVQLNLGDEYQKVEYLYKVDRGLYGNDCPLCQLKIPFTDIELKSDITSNDLLFSSYDIYDMADKFKWIPEDNVPENREAIELVPDIVSIIKSNGAFIARKFRDLISDNFDIQNFNARPMLIVCPDESGANSLANYLRLMQGFTIIRVPQDILNSCREKTVDIATLSMSWQGMPWYMQLQSAQTTQPIIILEEFSVTKKTKEILIEIVDLLKKNILCHFTLIDFLYHPDPKKSVKTYSLYSFKINNDNFCYGDS